MNLYAAQRRDNLAPALALDAGTGTASLAQNIVQLGMLDQALRASLRSLFGLPAMPTGPQGGLLQSPQQRSAWPSGGGLPAPMGGQPAVSTPMLFSPGGGALQTPSLRTGGDSANAPAFTPFANPQAANAGVATPTGGHAPVADSGAFAPPKHPDLIDAMPVAVPGLGQKGFGAAGKLHGKDDVYEDGDKKGQRKPSKANPIASGMQTDKFLVEPSVGTERRSNLGGREVDNWSNAGGSGSSLEQTGAWSRSKELAHMENGKLALQGYGEVAAGAQAKHVQTTGNAIDGATTLMGGGLAGAEARGYGQVNWGVGGYNIQAGGQAKLGAFGDGGVEWSGKHSTVNIGGYSLNVTPSASAKGSAMVGGEVGGTAFAGVSYPTPEEMAKGARPRYGAELQGNAFAGAKIDGTATVGVGGNSVGVSGGLMAGIGAEAKAKAELSGGKLKLELKLGAALGLGASVGLKLDINVQPLIDAGKKVKEHFENVGDAYSEANKKAGGGVKGFFAGVGAGIKKFFGG
ncbi:hypothetical protein OOT46_08765 [Aquabacterium sp. A7-Y]|uniref:hypothetical protein n=1 Tax=Aquabacterium sp. A7-Y TaxID=1349605 RepID=UPI00223DBF39|nr:hypothetical protein [Aquabacterium sp. A7-Y]MCW7537940.1 hypothetical protein [Aquabacterium sp. A7-Y]